MSSGFYKAFEDKFRGEREVIKTRLKVYLPFLQVLKDTYQDADVVDLGCGRGEWLELLRENGFSAQGVDLDSGMLSDCQDLGLKVQKDDAIAFLKNLPDESQLVVSGFHLAEHIPFDDLQMLVKESLRVLKPAGLLILETPNPENIMVGTSTFYLDPTHIKPIPPQLMAFLPEYYGFSKVKILRLQESLNLADNEKLSLLNVLGGVSPDYAVVAQKNAENKLLNLTNKTFGLEYGVTLEQLTMTFGEQNDQAKEHTQWLQNEIESARVRFDGVSGELTITKSHAEQLCAQLEVKERVLVQTQSKVDEFNQSIKQLDKELKAVYTSKSWRIMLQLRKIMHLMISLLQKLKQLARASVVLAMRYAVTQPQLKATALAILFKFPRIKVYLNKVALRAGLSTKSANTNSVIRQRVAQNFMPVQEHHSSSRAAQIYAELQNEIEMRNQ